MFCKKKRIKFVFFFPLTWTLLSSSSSFVFLFIVLEIEYRLDYFLDTECVESFSFTTLFHFKIKMKTLTVYLVKYVFFKINLQHFRESNFRYFSSLSESRGHEVFHALYWPSKSILASVCL